MECLECGIPESEAGRLYEESVIYKPIKVGKKKATNWQLLSDRPRHFNRQTDYVGIAHFCRNCLIGHSRWWGYDGGLNRPPDVDDAVSEAILERKIK